MHKTACTIALGLSLGAGASTLIFSNAAFAADNTMSSDQATALCTTLSGQFDGLKPFKEGLPYWQTSDAAFKAGKADCADGKPIKGAKAMQTAISDLYVAPDTL